MTMIPTPAKRVTQSEPQTPAREPRRIDDRRITHGFRNAIPLLPRLLTIVMLPTGVVSASPPTSDSRPVWTPTGQVSPDLLREASGLVESRRQPGVFWTHGDSGNDPKLVAIDTSGIVVAEVMIQGAPNTDWEDICADPQGHLYIGDIGNSVKVFPARYIYRLDEPDPRNPPNQPVTATRYLRFKYPDGQRLNFESLFWHAGSLYVLARGIGPTTVYRVEPTRGTNAKLVPVASLPLSGATSADVSADGTRLAIFAKNATWVFPFTGDNRFVDSSGLRRVTYPIQGVVEGGCFDGKDLRFITEAGSVYHVAAKQLARQTRFRRR